MQNAHILKNGIKALTVNLRQSGSLSQMHVRAPFYGIGFKSIFIELLALCFWISHLSISSISFVCLSW